jgi:hypothetical protein
MSVDNVESCLDRIEQMRAALVEQEKVKDWYTTADVRRILGGT